MSRLRNISICRFICIKCLFRWHIPSQRVLVSKARILIYESVLIDVFALWDMCFPSVSRGQVNASLAELVWLYNIKVGCVKYCPLRISNHLAIENFSSPFFKGFITRVIHKKERARTCFCAKMQFFSLFGQYFQPDDVIFIPNEKSFWFDIFSIFCRCWYLLIPS